MTTHSQRNIAGRQLSNRYMLLSLIAQGGMGEVWKARDQVTGTLVAAKVLRTELTGEEISLSRLRLEAKNAMRAKHPNIATVLDSGEDDNQGWIIMELVEGDPLTRFVGDGSRLTEAELIPVLIQTAYALDAAARAGVVHRDIKPANIMIRPDGKVKLTDFGVSFSDGQANLTAAGMVMGTAQYLPPEQAVGNPATPVGDLYALGIIAYEALVGRRPYTGKTQVDVAFAHVNEEIPTLPSTVAAPMAELVYRLLAKDPAERPQTGAALARELVGVAATLRVGTDPVPLTATKEERVVTPPVPAPVYPTPPAASPIPPAAPVASVSASAARPPVQHVTKQHLPESAHWYPVSRQDGPPSPETKMNPLSRERQAKAGSRVGLFVIVGLIALTLILIAIAMVRGSAESASASSLEGATTGSCHIQEVELWLTPTLGV